MSKSVTKTGKATSIAAKLFDLRLLVGALFTLYGIILIIAGFFASAADKQKASGVNINLWMGLGMLALGLLFLLWWRLRPLQLAEPSRNEEDDSISTEDRARREERPRRS
ncbi:MAG: hypothetical protein NVSMB52_14600 [Chloroflexota bacterium]